MRNFILPAFAALTLLLAQGAMAANYTPAMVNGTAITVKTVASGFTLPLYLAAPAGDPRLFVVEKGGLIKVIKDGSTLPTPFLDLSALIKPDLSLRLGTDLEGVGLLGLAFDPDFAHNGKFYI